MHVLHWGYSLIPITTQEMKQYVQKFKNSTYYLKHGIIINSVKNLLTTNYLAAEPVGVTTKMKIEPLTD
jgi:hypothetical protein